MCLLELLLQLLQFGPLILPRVWYWRVRCRSHTPRLGLSSSDSFRTIGLQVLSRDWPDCKGVTSGRHLLLNEQHPLASWLPTPSPLCWPYHVLSLYSFFFISFFIMYMYIFLMVTIPKWKQVDRMLVWCSAGCNKLGAHPGSELYDTSYGFSYWFFSLVRCFDILFAVLLPTIFTEIVHHGWGELS